MKIVDEQFLVEKGFESNGDSFGWSKYRKDGFELIKIPLKNGGYVIGFEYRYCSQVKYKFPLKIEELETLYKILTNKEL